MQGTIVNFRRGKRTQTLNHLIISLSGVDNREKASKLVGKIVAWKSPAGKEIKGKIVKAHGNSGAVRVIFERGMPGQSIGTKLEVK